MYEEQKLFEAVFRKTNSYGKLILLFGIDIFKKDLSTHEYIYTTIATAYEIWVLTSSWKTLLLTINKAAIDTDSPSTKAESSEKIMLQKLPDPNEATDEIIRQEIYLTVEEVCKRLRISRLTLYRWGRSCPFDTPFPKPAIASSGGFKRYLTSEILDWEATCMKLK